MAVRPDHRDVNQRQHVSLMVSVCFYFCGLLFLGGLTMMMTLSPAQKSNQMLARSVEALSMSNAPLAKELALQSLSYQTHNRAAWSLLSAALAAQGDAISSNQAHDFSFLLANKTREQGPVYAVPTELRLGLLAPVPQGSF